MFSSSTASMLEQLYINGVVINADTLSSWRVGKTGIAAELADFLNEWFSPESTVTLHTSGSTGKPKLIHASKEAMRASAKRSCEVFDLKSNSKALLCLPLRYIAGKMMVVRALVSGAELVLQEPCSTPLEKLSEPVDFAPLVPMQAATTLQQQKGKEQLERARCILLGGGFINASLEEELQHVNSCIYASYGMTETFSHIALRHVNGPERSEWYTPLRGIHVSLTPEGTLSLSAPHLGISQLSTNDIAEPSPDGRFRICGRKDAVINSGGIKIQAEDVEQALTAATHLTLMAVPAPDEVLGQCVALLWEGPTSAEAHLLGAISTLPAYHRPRIIQHVSSLPRTSTGKLSRSEAAALLS